MPRRVEISDTDWRELEALLDVMEGVEEPSRLQMLGALTRAFTLLSRVRSAGVDLTCSGCGQVIRDAHACPGRPEPDNLVMEILGNVERVRVVKALAAHRGTNYVEAAKFLDQLRAGHEGPRHEIENLRDVLAEAGVSVRVAQGGEPVHVVVPEGEMLRQDGDPGDTRWRPSRVT